MLNRISANIYKTPTNMEPNLLETHRQLAMTLYRLGHECSFWFICNLFRASTESAVATFNIVLWETVSQLFHEYEYMPTSEEERIAECKWFIDIVNSHVLVRGMAFMSTCLYIWKITAASKTGTRSETWDL